MNAVAIADPRALEDWGISEVQAARPQAKTSPPTPVSPPIYAPRWWYSRGRHDARPIAWSLRNRPQDWSIRHADGGDFAYLTHKPSNHVFRVGSNQVPVLERRTSCDCSYIQKYQQFQRRDLRKAYLHFLTKDGTMATHFAEHFINPVKLGKAAA